MKHPISFLLPCLLCLPWSATAADKPNIVLVLADDLGYECIGVNGGTSYQTPHLDKLAASGMRFEHCHSQPLCTPTRVQLMTGLYNVRNYTRFGELDRAQTTFAHRLKQAGYATGIFGKWQLGQQTDAPRHFGFDEACLWQHTRRPPRYANPGLEFDGAEKDFTHGEYGPDVVHEQVLAFVANHKTRPFLLYYPMILTHSPYQPTPDSAGWDPKAKGEKVNNNRKYFADMVRHMDKHIGSLVALLEKHGLRENTLIMFLGDNGTGGGVESRMGERVIMGGKGQSKAGGTHVPFIASWPAVIPAGRVNAGLVDTTDFLPTMCEAAGVLLPDGQPCDGHSLLEQLRGRKGQPREWIYVWHPTREREFAADQRFKLYAGGQMFDYAADALETEPLKTAGAEAVAARAKLQAALDRFKDARPAALKASDGAGYQQNAGKKQKGGRAGKSSEGKILK